MKVVMYGYISNLKPLPGSVIYVQAYGDYPADGDPNQSIFWAASSTEDVTAGFAVGMNVNFDLDSNGNLIFSSVVWDGTYTGGA